jgi:hypothetical protein
MDQTVWFGLCGGLGLVSWMGCPRKRSVGLGWVCVRFLRTQQRVKSQCLLQALLWGLVPCAHWVFWWVGDFFEAVHWPLWGLVFVRFDSLRFGASPGFVGGVLCGLDGEFDPGSGRTLAACLTHASRAERPFGVLERRTGE